MRLLRLMIPCENEACLVVPWLFNEQSDAQAGQDDCTEWVSGSHSVLWKNRLERPSLQRWHGRE